MADTLSPAQRHTNMAAIRGKNTKPEIIVRKFLWNNGFRYRLNHHRLPGKPDIVLRKYKTCIFVNGCFWHGHNVQVRSEKLEVSSDIINDLQNSECCKIPHTNREFWVKKILRNQQRDEEVKAQLLKMGWHCITVWECELKPKNREATLQSLLYTMSKIFLDNHRSKKYSTEEEDYAMVAET